MTSTFALLTAAKNEALHIGKGIESVLKQGCRPMRWLIVDDGSTDATAAVVASCAAGHPFIELHSNRNLAKRSFGAQYRALNSAWARLRELPFEFVAVQDADIVLPETDYFERVLAAFEADPALGIAGGYIHEAAAGQWRSRRSNSPDSVAGAVQFFRRACFEQIGGFQPLLHGGEDWLAQIDARRAGWRVRALTDLPVEHHRPTSSSGGRLRGIFKLGLRDASFGSTTAFEALKCARRMPEPPWVTGAVVRAAGYAWYRLSGRAPLLTDEQLAFLRHEQGARVHQFVTRRAAQPSTQP